MDFLTEVADVDKNSFCVFIRNIDYNILVHACHMILIQKFYLKIQNVCDQWFAIRKTSLYSKEIFNEIEWCLLDAMHSQKFVCNANVR